VQQRLSGYVAGMTWGWVGRRGSWATPSARESLATMQHELGTTWVALAFAALQATAQSTTISWRDEPTLTDDELVGAIEHAHSLGLKVCLKPVVNCADGTWRAHINFFDIDVPPEPRWSQWWASYTEFVVHYATIAEQTGCAMFCIGCEMVQADRRETEWRALVAEVRRVYSGLVTYNCDKYQEDHVTWWDAVDVISSSGYYPVGHWDEQLDRIEVVVRREDKPFLFLEAGCPSRDGSQHLPNDWTHPGSPSVTAQAEWYEEALVTTEKRDWVGGFVLWDWPAELPTAPIAEDRDYNVHRKPAAALVREHYRRMTAR
jgi:glycosyl hydrolase family 113